MDDELHERVREVIAGVPAGKVATYGDIAAISGAPSPRLVGRILAEDGHDLPWHRILRANGTVAPHLLDEQLELFHHRPDLGDLLAQHVAHFGLARTGRLGADVH